MRTPEAIEQGNNTYKNNILKETREVQHYCNYNTEQFIENMILSEDLL